MKAFRLCFKDLWQLSNEINKLIAYFENKQIDAEDVKNMIATAAIEENIFALTDAIASKNKVLALKLTEEQIEAGMNEIQMLVMVMRQFSILARVKNAMENGLSSRDMATALKIHPYVVQKSLTQARGFAAEELQNILNNLVQIECRAKSGQGSIKVLLEILIMKL